MRFLYATIVLVLCTVIGLLGSSIFAKASNFLLVILLLATFAIPASAVLVEPFYDPRLDISFTGLSVKTLKANLMPQFKKHAAGVEGNGTCNLYSLKFLTFGD